jgi:UDP-N-acetylglucosamine 2-epimerase (non-hydrolysing)
MKILCFFGTRPEAIKLAPLIKEFQNNKKFDIRVCISAQHREMLDQVLAFFNITPDFDLNLMKSQQTLFSITTKALNGIRKVISSYRPDWLFIQGDTSTTFAGALAAFYEKVKIAHVEAGLRSFNKYSPFPEEINRVLTTHLADLHFAPTARSKRNLLREGIPEERIFVVGNTSIDALILSLKQISGKSPEYLNLFKDINFGKKVILVTGHRRESFGKPFENICRALKKIAQRDDVEVVYPVHLNPNVKKPVLKILKGISNIHLMKPLDYASFVWLMNRSYIILTDSGGIQEEAPSLGKPVLVMRDITERLEGIEAGTAVLVGTDTDRIVHYTLRLLKDKKYYNRMASTTNLYGDGMTCRKIRQVIEKYV